MADTTEIFNPRDLDEIAPDGSAPATAPEAYPARTWQPGMTRKAAAAALGCSESLIRKRLKQLEQFHSATALVAPDGSLSEAGFIAIERLGRLGIVEYRQQYSQRAASTALVAPAPTAPGGAMVTYGGGAIVPEICSQGSGAVAVATDLDRVTGALNARRADIERRKLELRQRGQTRDRDLGQLVTTVRQLEQGERELQQLELFEAAKDHAADMIRRALGNAASPPAAGASGGQ